MGGHEGQGRATTGGTQSQFLWTCLINDAIVSRQQMISGLT